MKVLAKPITIQFFSNHVIIMEFEDAIFFPEFGEMLHLNGLKYTVYSSQIHYFNDGDSKEEVLRVFCATGK